MKLMPRDSETLVPNLTTSKQHIQDHIGRYVFAAQFISNKTVLDVACGRGYGTSYLASRGAEKVIGGDISKEVVEYGIQHYHKSNLSFVCLNAQQLPYPADSFDVIVSFETIEHLKAPDSFLRECRRVLKNGGIFICSTPNNILGSQGKPNSPYHSREFNVEEFQQLLSGYFQNIELNGYIHDKSKKMGIMQKLVAMLESIVYSMPGVLQTVIMKVVAGVTTFICREYHPIKLTDIDEGDFDKILSADFKPFPIGNSSSKYILAMGWKI